MRGNLLVRLALRNQQRDLALPRGKRPCLVGRERLGRRRRLVESKGNGIACWASKSLFHRTFELSRSEPLREFSGLGVVQASKSFPTRELRYSHGEGVADTHELRRAQVVARVHGSPREELHRDAHGTH